MSETSPAAVVILAAGEGTRMKSRTPKVLHTLSGRSLLGHAIAAASGLRPDRLVVVVGHAGDEVRAAAVAAAPQADIVVQQQRLGTGHAVRMVIEAVGAMSGTVVVTYGDMPLLRGATLRQLVSAHHEAGNAVTVLTARGDFPGFGRIVRDADGAFLRIVEERDATAAERAIDEFNSGCYAFNGALLADAVKRVTTDNSQHEEYLTDVVEI
ncbi:MAG: NTP transferase domain-containing protein, partial [Trebonia sp.]